MEDGFIALPPAGWGGRVQQNQSFVMCRRRPRLRRPRGRAACASDEPSYRYIWNIIGQMAPNPHTYYINPFRIYSACQVGRSFFCVAASSFGGSSCGSNGCFDLLSRHVGLCPPHLLRRPRPYETNVTCQCRKRIKQIHKCKPYSKQIAFIFLSHKFPFSV